MTPGDALDASASAGAEAGTRAADTTTVACDLVRIGMFFDGTGNSRDEVGTGNIDSWHSNVDLLQYRYKNSGDPEVAIVNGAEIQARFGRRYIRGVGIEEGGGNQQWGFPRGTAWGTGPEGDNARTQEWLEAARQEIRVKADGLEPCFVWLDVFGFSRGACVARDFANDIKEGAIEFAGQTAKVQFMGLWDTVSSIGNAGNMGNWDAEGVRINTSETAEDIVHITAKDELRVNFPLTRASKGLQIDMIGAHSDIGGGYEPGTTKGSVSYYIAEGMEPFFNTVATRWGLDLGEWQEDYSVRDRESATFDGDQLREVILLSSPSHHAKIFRWEAEHGLQFVSLRIMHDQAVNKKVPLEPLGDNIEGIKVGISGDLLAYYNQIKSPPHKSDPQTELEIRRKYAHMSANASIGMGPEPSGKRRQTSM